MRLLMPGTSMRPLLVMAALMIPGGKLTDRYGRTRLFRLGLVVYGVGALISAAAPNLGVLIIGNSILEGVGTAMLIPPVYILTTLLFTGVAGRARAFGAISAAGGVGAAAGPLLGGLITSAIRTFFSGFRYFCTSTSTGVCHSSLRATSCPLIETRRRLSHVVFSRAAVVPPVNSVRRK